MTDAEKFEQLVQKIAPQSKLLRMWQLKGGVSAQVTALEIMRSEGQIQKLIVRQHGAVDLKNNPHIAADEFKLLQMLHSAGLPTPTPYHFDESGAFATPCIVLEYVEGESEFAPADLSDFIRQFAATLARIHCVTGSTLDFSFLPKQEERVAKKLRERPGILDASIQEARIRDILESVFPLRQSNPLGLLHGDFWNGNLLWKEGRLVAVIDWEDAAVGDPLADLANSRLETLWAFGSDAMQDFTQQYQSLMLVMDFTNLPYWDLYAALRPAFKITEWAGDASRERTMRERHQWFVTQAFEKLSVQSKK